MNTSDFNFDLPKSFIAQSPAVPRDSSKLLVFDTKSGNVYHKHFSDIADYLDPGDTLVVNKSKVIPSRIIFNAKEVFLLKALEDDLFLCLVRPGKHFKLGKTADVNSKLSFEVVDILEDGTRKIRFFSDNLEQELELAGQTPLPPYIQSNPKFFDDYQTVYADDSHKGSVAAPTAGLHFTDELIKNLKDSDINFEEIVLHVGRGTFLPVSSEKLSEHKMHSEDYILTKELADKLNSRRGKLVAVGTTSVRVLESSFDDGFIAQNSSTDIFIYPGKYKWKAVDSLITNFHLPKSTLIMLVASFLENKGVEDPVKKILELYELAKENDYRFYSFGDSMLAL